MNPYFAFTHTCNAKAPTVILASGQACVWYRLALASKDGDWIIRHEQSALDTVLGVLAGMGATYRLGTPLALPWLKAGWSSHFEATAADGARLRFDFVSHPPRLSPSQLQACWARVDRGAEPVIGRQELIALKRTMRLKDYAFIGALALQLENPEQQLAHTLDAEHLLQLLDQHPELRARLSDVRPALKEIPLQVDAIAEAIDKEMRQAQRQDERRIKAYASAMEPWSQRYRSLDLGRDDLITAHGRLCAEAATCLPTEVSLP